jgi:hypothetical protein
MLVPRESDWFSLPPPTISTVCNRLRIIRIQLDILLSVTRSLYYCFGSRFLSTSRSQCLPARSSSLSGLPSHQRLPSACTTSLRDICSSPDIVMIDQPTPPAHRWTSRVMDGRQRWILVASGEIPFLASGHCSHYCASAWDPRLTMP